MRKAGFDNARACRDPCSTRKCASLMVGGSWYARRDPEFAVASVWAMGCWRIVENGQDGGALHALRASKRFSMRLDTVRFVKKSVHVIGHLIICVDTWKLFGNVKLRHHNSQYIPTTDL